MFIATEEQDEAVNTQYITDMVVTLATPEDRKDPEDWNETWKVIANVNYPDRTRKIILFEDPRRNVALAMLRTYIELINRKKS